MEGEHIVKSFDEELSHINNLIAEMGGFAEIQLARAVDALKRRDSELAEQVIRDDRQIDNLEQAIDEVTIRILALRNPVADDLRLVTAALKIASNLERIGDYTKNIAKRTITLSHSHPISGVAASIVRMSALVQDMIKNVLDAYANRDDAKATDVRDRDEEVDQHHTSLFRELLTYMMEDARNITPCTHLLFIAKNVERIGDHVTSIAEQVHFMSTGTKFPTERAKKDDASATVVNP